MLIFSLCVFVQGLTIYLYDDPEIRLLGASSMLYFMAALWLVWYLRYQKKKNRTQKILRVVAFTFVMLFPSTFSPTTSYLGHFLGFLVGVCCGLVLHPLKEEQINPVIDSKIN